MSHPWGTIHEHIVTIKEVGTFYGKIRERATFQNWATTYLNLYQCLFNFHTSHWLPAASQCSHQLSATAGIQEKVNKF